MKLIIVRHGETEANVRKINPGKEGTKLTKKGLKQASKTGEYLANQHIDVVYCSDLGRAMDTYKEISEFVKAPVHFVPELRERKLGVFESKPQGTFRKFIEKNKLDLLHYTPEGGESIMESFERIRQFYNKCMNENMGKTVLWISHGGILRKIIAHYLKKEHFDYAELHPSNCSVTIIELSEDGSSHVPLVNYIDHLKDIE